MCYFITWNSKQTSIPRKKKKSTLNIEETISIDELSKSFRNPSSTIEKNEHPKAYGRNLRRRRQMRAPLEGVPSDPTLNFFSLFHCSSSSRCVTTSDASQACSLSQVLLPPRALEDEPLWICNRFNPIGVSRLPAREPHAYARGAHLYPNFSFAVNRLSFEIQVQRTSSIELIRPNIYP